MEMTQRELIERIEEIKRQWAIEVEWEEDLGEETDSRVMYSCAYNPIAIRFDNRDLEVWTELDNSRHNSDREDERDFPEYGTEEYDDMEELDGTSAWTIDDGSGIYKPSRGLDSEVSSFFDHTYIIIGDGVGIHDDTDHEEILIRNAKVYAKLF